MTIYNLYMNNAEPLTPYDLITVGDSNNGELIWSGLSLNSRQNIHTKRLNPFAFEQNLITATFTWQFKKRGNPLFFYISHMAHASGLRTENKMSRPFLSPVHPGTFKRKDIC